MAPLTDDAGETFRNVSSQWSNAGNRDTMAENTRLGTFHKRFPQYNSDEAVKRVIARFDFEAGDPDEMSFRRGEVIEVVGQEDENWWRGRMPGGRTGLFPANYVDHLPSVL
ncbi:unnamed protein product [Protopolystoma xenopodis]|uniref:SH3 domain-containing protein n=1 Tax=Protopolystoma xenopodis TaxID=117903 RepID=A0A448XF99_9PLAT|nr:unnamed protein product [Protopolystoma xenopodis]